MIDFQINFHDSVSFFIFRIFSSSISSCIFCSLHHSLYSFLFAIYSSLLIFSFFKSLSTFLSSLFFFFQSLLYHTFFPELYGIIFFLFFVIDLLTFSLISFHMPSVSFCILFLHTLLILYNFLGISLLLPLSNRFFLSLLPCSYFFSSSLAVSSTSSGTWSDSVLIPSSTIFISSIAFSFPIT